MKYAIEFNAKVGLWELIGLTDREAARGADAVWDFLSDHPTEAEAASAKVAAEREEAEARGHDRAEAQQLGRMMGETDDLDALEDPVMLMVDAAGEAEDNYDPDACTNPKGHSWAYTGSAYGGDDDSYHGEGRCYCEWCGADGDA